jgi:ornithine cyclodeaminase
MNIKYADRKAIAEALPFDILVNKLREAFLNNSIVTPMRHHHDYKNPGEELDATLLLMPSWNPGSELGVKLVTVSPQNAKYDLPSIQGLYVLFDAKNGQLQLLLDAMELTAKRTAATSALASSYLSRVDSEVLLMVGTGALAPNLIHAHATVRPIKRVLIWGRNPEKAQAICDSFSESKLEVVFTETLDKGIMEADIVSCATLSNSPLILGAKLHAGQHIDLVGAYKKDMREADDDLISRSELFIDTDAALKETGDLVIPLREGIISAEDICGDLFQLCNGKIKGRTTEDQITCFKSVGHAMEDLIAASMVNEALANESD